jgi:hypothetical protein
MAMGNSLSLVISNIFMEHFEKIALDTNPLNSSDTFVVWPHRPARLQQFLHHTNSLRPTIKFTMEVEVNDTSVFLDVLFVMSGFGLAMKVYQNHPRQMKGAVIHSLVSRAKTIFQNQKDFNRDIKNI